MPIIEMRESIGDIDVNFANDQDALQVVQKRINLKEGSLQRNMLSMDLFFDDPPHVIGGTTPKPFDGIVEFLLTPTPVILSKESILLKPRRSMDASNTNVLFKAIITPKDSGNFPNGLAFSIDRFPQDFIASNANFPFYHDQLYLTMIFHASVDQQFPIDVRFSASMMVSYKQKQISAVRAAMGVISERFNSMIAQQESLGRVMERPANLQGQYIPSYEWGGIRPEFMVSGQNLTQYWLKQDGQQPETMQTTSSLRAIAKQARQMVPNPDAFGTPGTANGDIPDWFATMLPNGVVAGAVREQFPPRVTQDDPTQNGLGNIICV
tara:strand:+ start:559 stop:1527 length:969 start_codon:yes stop_codon:yes gene_type:complete